MLSICPFNPENSETLYAYLADLYEKFGGCASCPGIARAGELKLEGEDPEEFVFCVHDGHKKTVVM
jgi:hypothetical protein